MEQAIIKLLDPQLECDDCYIINNQIIFKTSSAIKSVNCPYCGKESTKVHSTY